jgi:superfamily II DNA or RNA helicase
MNGLIVLDDVDTFERARAWSSDQVSPVLPSVARLDEAEELEPLVRSILADLGETPHGPAEIVDILTHTVKVRGERGMAAFILKGKSTPRVKPRDVAHQIYRLEKIADLRFAFFISTGAILDAAKEQFVSTAARLNCKYSIFGAVEIARLAVAYGFFCPRDGSRLIGGRCRCGYTATRRELNVLQQEALRALSETHALGQQAGVVVLPTGSGKTHIAAQDSFRSRAKRVLYVAHSHEILDVAEVEFSAIYGSESVVHHRTGASLARLARVNLATATMLAGHLAAVAEAGVDYLVIDEFHHAAAPTYRRLLARTRSAFVLGLTATPFRADRQDILELCSGNVIVNFELRLGIETGILAPYHYFGCFDDVDYSRLERGGRRYTIRDLERAVTVPERDAAIVRKWNEHANDKPTIAFCVSHRHAARVAAAFRREGVPAVEYVSTVAFEDRRAIVERARTGDVRVLCTVDVLNEGVDLPFIECLLFLRPTDSKRVFLQQLGRGLRRYIGKSHCTVVDFIGNFKNAIRIVEYHGLLPYDEVIASDAKNMSTIRSASELLNLPVGCTVNFDERVIDLFAQQIADPRFITRHTIARILIYQFERLERQLGRRPTRTDVNRSLLLDSTFYALVFGSWKRFDEIMNTRSSA